VGVSGGVDGLVTYGVVVQCEPLHFAIRVCIRELHALSKRHPSYQLVRMGIESWESVSLDSLVWVIACHNWAVRPFQDQATSVVSYQ
jgi:hypothetical protein